MTIGEILSLRVIENDYAIHYINEEGKIVASIFKSLKDLNFPAYMGDDDHVISFSFTHTGPVAIIYDRPVQRADPMPLNTFLCVIAIMSVVTFGDISLHNELSPAVFPCKIGQFDVGDPGKFFLAQQLICSYTKKEWSERGIADRFAIVAESFLSNYKK